MKTAVIIFNSQNRKSYFLQDIDILIKGLNERGYLTIVRATLSSTDLIDYTLALDECDLLVGAGGDGTIHEIVNAVSKNKKIDPKVLFYPTGTVNDFATSLLIDSDIMSGLKMIDDDKYYKVDSALINGETYFNYVCAFGPFTSASYSVSHNLKRDLGAFAYVIKGLGDMATLAKTYHIKAVVDGREVEGDYSFGMIVNSHSVGGFKHVFKSTDITDGYYTLFLFKSSPFTIKHTPRILLNGIGQEYVSSEVVCLSFKQLSIQTDENIAWTIDGERGPVGSFDCKVVPKNLNIYTNL